MTNTPTPVVPSTYAGEQAAELLSATGTANDGAIVPLVYPALAGLPVDSGNPLPVTQSNVAKETGGNLAAILAELGTILTQLQSTLTVAGAVVVTDSVPLSVSGTVTANVGTGTQPVSAASLPLPTGAAVESGGHLASLDTKLPAQGQALAAASVPVVLTAAQQTALTPPAAITGFALEAGHLATIETSTAKIPAQGQALAAASLPVVLTAIQQTALTPPAAITNFANETGGNLATVAGAVSGGKMQTALTTLLAGEDQTNSVFAMLVKLLVSAAYSPSLATNFGTLTKALVKATPAQVYSVRVSNANAAARYLLLHNKSTAPVATDVPLYAFYVPAGAAVTIGTDFFTANGAYCATGLGWSISTTAATFTDSATASDTVVAVHYA